MAQLPCRNYLNSKIQIKMEYEISNYQDSNDFDRINNAPERRKKGLQMLEEIKRVKQGWARTFTQGKAQGMTPIAILKKYISKNPEGIDAAKDYIRSRGIVPAEALDEIAMQYARLRDAQINDVVDMYDCSNYEEYDGSEDYEGEADNLFGRTGKRYRMKHDGKSRREVRQERRANRKAAKGEVGDEAILPAEAQLASAGDVTPGLQPADLSSPMPQPSFSQTLPPLEISEPSREEAEAEILGEESDYESYDGEHEKILPLLKAIDLLGRENFDNYCADNATGQQPIDWGNLFQQIASTGQAVAGAVKQSKANKKGGGKIDPKAVYSQVKENITEKEKNQYLKDNSGKLIAVVIGIALVGYLIAKA